jgi:hypothetical protein
MAQSLFQISVVRACPQRQKAVYSNGLRWYFSEDGGPGLRTWKTKPSGDVPLFLS